MNKKYLATVSTLILVAATLCYAAASFVQSKYSEGFSVTTLDWAMPSNVAAGNVLVGQVGWASSSITLNSVVKQSGTCTATFTILDNPTTAGSVRGASFYASNIGGGPCTIRATFSSSVGDIRGAIHEVSGLATTDPLDQHVCNPQTNPGTGTDAITSTAKTTTANGEYIFGGTFASGGNPSSGTGYTQPADRATVFQDEYQIQSSAGSIAATFTSAQEFATYVTCMVTLKVPAAGGVAKRKVIIQ